MWMGMREQCESNQEMVDMIIQTAAYSIPDNVADAFRDVQREHFLPPELEKSAVYQLGPLYLEHEDHGVLHQSSPSIYAQVLTELKFKHGDMFLNVGSGTGYLSALACRAMEHTGRCVGLEVRDKNIPFARTAVSNVFGEADPKCIEFIHCNVFNVDVVNSVKFDKIYVAAEVSTDQLQILLHLLAKKGTLICPHESVLLMLKKDRYGRVKSRHNLCSVMFRCLEDSTHMRDLTVLRPTAQRWSTKEHRRMQMPARFHDVAMTLLLIEQRNRVQDGPILVLPTEIVLHILGMMRREWFYSTDVVLPSQREYTAAQKFCELAESAFPPGGEPVRFIPEDMRTSMIAKAAELRAYFRAYPPLNFADIRRRMRKRRERREAGDDSDDSETASDGSTDGDGSDVPDDDDNDAIPFAENRRLLHFLNMIVRRGAEDHHEDGEEDDGENGAGDSGDSADEEGDSDAELNAEE